MVIIIIKDNDDIDNKNDDDDDDDDISSIKQKKIHQIPQRGDFSGVLKRVLNEFYFAW